MAISLLGNLPAPTNSYGSLSYNPVNQQQPINAQSVTTGLPVAGSITGTPMGVTPKSPATNVTGPAKTLPKSQVSAPPVNTSSFTPSQQSAGLVGGQNSSSSNNTGLLGANAGLLGNANAQTPEQILAADPSRIDPTLNGAPTPITVSSGSLGTGTPAGIAGNQTPTGLLGNMVGQSQDLYQQENALNTPYIQQNMDTIQQATAEEEQLTGGSYSGTAADYSGRLAQLENIKQTAQANVNAAQQNLGTFSGQAQTALSTGLTAATNQVQSPYGQPLFNPVTGAVTSGGQPVTGGTMGTGIGGGIQPSDPAYPALQQYANYAAQGLGAQIPSAWTSNPVLNAQINSMATQINPNYNPLTTPLNATTQAGANANIGAANQTAAGATQQAISRIGNITSNMNSFLTQWGLNQSSSPYINQPISTFLSSSQGAGAEASWKLITSDLTAATSQLMSTPGVTPTGFTNELSSFDPTNLSPSELNTYLQSLSVAGQYQLNSYQTTSTSAYNSNNPTPSPAVTPYTGNQTSTTPPPLPTPTGPGAAAFQQANNAPNFGNVTTGLVEGALGDAKNILSAVAGWAISLF